MASLLCTIFILPLFFQKLLYSSKKPYGNKTGAALYFRRGRLYSSKKPYGNKTYLGECDVESGLYSSKKPYGNKTIKA